MALIVVAASATEATIRTAIETTAADGDAVQLTAPQAVTLTGGPFQVQSKGIRVFGNGNPRDVVITGKAASAQALIEVKNNLGGAAANYRRCLFENMSLVGDVTSTDGIAVTGTAGKGHWSQFGVSNCIFSTLRDAISVQMPNLGADSMVHAAFDGLEVTSGRRYGVNLSNVTMARIVNSEINSCDDVGLRALTCPNIWIGAGTAVEGNNTGNHPVQATGEGGSQVFLKLCHGFVISGLDVEALPTALAASKSAVTASNCNGGLVDMLTVAAGDLTQFAGDTYGVRLVLGCRGISVRGIVHQYIQNPLAWDRTCKVPDYMESMLVQSLPSVSQIAGLPT